MQSRIWSNVFIIISQYYYLQCFTSFKILTLLGPKTEEDLAKPAKVPKVAAESKKEKNGPKEKSSALCNGSPPAEPGIIIGYKQPSRFCRVYSDRYENS